MPNDLGLSHGAIVYAEAGRAAGSLAVSDSPELFVFLVFGTERPPFGAYPDKAEQIRRTSAVFANDGWEVPRLLNALLRADDLYFDTVRQIRMPCWSRGRISLVGDAAFAPSFRSGQGTSLALVGAYVLAGELAAHDDPADAFAAYEPIMRPFVEANQALATKDKASLLFPRTQQDLDRMTTNQATTSGRRTMRWRFPTMRVWSKTTRIGGLIMRIASPRRNSNSLNQRLARVDGNGFPFKEWYVMISR
jgi:2-polyprenyl-6-methoxyphenol hydroxylase-like FAD-dependent oxidoreductase